MQKPKFRVPTYVEKRTGRIMIFLASVAAVSYILARAGQDYTGIYANSQISLPVAADLVLAATQFIATFWWVVALAAVMISLLFIAVTKSGTAFTLLSILVWLAGAAAYAVLWLPSRALEKTAGG